MPGENTKPESSELNETERIRQAGLVSLSIIRDAYPRLGIALAYQKSTTGGDLDFDKRRWLEYIYKDLSDDIVIQKASQIGVTDWILCDLIHEAEQGRPTLIVWPTDSMRNDIVARRIDRQIEQVKYYRTHCAAAKKDSDNLSQKRLFGTDCRFVGAQSPKGFYEFPADTLIVDEYDLCDQDNLAYAYDRLSASKNPKTRIVGNPTVSGYGMADVFMDTDCNEWHIKCPHCGEWQILDWFKNVVTDGSGRGEYELRDPDAQVVCRKCEKVIDRLSDGQWVPRYPDKSVRGYRCDQLFGIPVENRIAILWGQFQKALLNQVRLQRFYNNVLGVVYDPKGAKITPPILAGCIATDQLRSLNQPTYVAGMDVGSVWHLHISEIRDGKRCKIFASTVEGRRGAERALHGYDIVAGVVDAQGDLNAVREFVAGNHNWWMCYYNKSEKVKDDMVLDYDKRVVQVNRTESLDASMAAYQRKEVILPPNYTAYDGGDFVTQMCAPTRLFDEKTGHSYWTKCTDHHRHADNYELVAFNIVGGAGSGFLGGWL